MNPADPPHDVARILAEIGDVFARADRDLPSRLATAIAGARRTLVHSAGRTGLVMRAMAMRLSHLGIDGHVVGDMTAPPVGPGDLLIVNASTGDLPSGVAHLESARRAGARTLVVTAARTGKALDVADETVRLPAQTMLDDVAGPSSCLPMGSQYELCLFVLTELVILELSRLLGVTFLEMRARHANVL